MANKVTIQLSVDLSDLEDMEDGAEDAGEEMESTVSKIKEASENFFSEQTFGGVKNALESVNEAFNDLVREGVQLLTQRLGFLGNTIEFIIERLLNLKDTLLTGPISAFSTSIGVLQGTMQGLLKTIPGIGNGLAKLQKQLVKFVPIIISVSSTFQSFVATQLAVLPTILGGVTTAFTALASTLGSSVQDSFNRIEEILVSTRQNFQGMREDLLKISFDAPEALDQVAKAMRTVAKAGIRDQKVLTSLTETVTKLGRLADASFTQVGKQITNIATSFDLLGKNAEENVQRFADDIVTVRDNTVAGVSEITTSLRRVASSASVLDVPVDQMLALTGAIQQAGQTARRSGTRLRRGFEEIVQTLSDIEGQKAFSDLLNISTRKFKDRIRNDVGDVIIDAANALGQSEKSAQNFAKTIDTLGTAGGTALTAVASKAGLMNELLQKMSGNMGAVQKSTDEVLGTFSNQFSILTGKISNFLSILSFPLTQALTQGLGFINNQLDRAEDEILELKEIIKNNLSDIGGNLQNLFGFTDEGFKLNKLEENIRNIFLPLANDFTSAISDAFLDIGSNVLVPLGLSFAQNTISTIRAFFSTEFGQLIVTSFNFAVNKLALFFDKFVRPVIVDIFTDATNIIAKKIPGINLFLGGQDPTENILNEKIENLELFKEENSSLIKEGQELLETLRRTKKLLPSLNDSEKKRVRQLLKNKKSAEKITKSLTKLTSSFDRSKDVVDTSFKEFVNRESSFGFSEAQDKIATNFVDTLFNIFGDQIVSKESKKQVTNAVRNILETGFGDDVTKKAIKKWKELTSDLLTTPPADIGENRLSRLSNNIKTGLGDFKRATEKIDKDSAKFLQDTTNFLNNEKAFLTGNQQKLFDFGLDDINSEIESFKQGSNVLQNEIMKGANNISSTLFTAGDSLRLTVDSIRSQRKLARNTALDLIKGEKSPIGFQNISKKLAESFSGFRDTILSSGDLTRAEVEDFNRRFQKIFGQNIIEATDAKNLKSAIKKVRENLKDVFLNVSDKSVDEVLDNTEFFEDEKNRIAQSAKKIVDDTKSIWANGIESAIFNEEFDAVKQLSRTFVQVFANELSTQMTKNLGVDQLAKDVAKFVNKTINKIFTQVAQNQQSQGASGGSGIISTVIQSIPFIGGGQRGGKAQLAGFANGGMVSGSGGLDQLLARLTRGEFVVRREAVNSNTLPLLKRLNESQGNFQRGGLVGSQSSGQSSNTGANQQPVNININAVDAQSFQQLVNSNPEIFEKQIIKQINKNSAIRDTLNNKARK